MTSIEQAVRDVAIVLSVLALVACSTPDPAPVRPAPEHVVEAPKHWPQVGDVTFPIVTIGGISETIEVGGPGLRSGNLEVDIP